MDKICGIYKITSPSGRIYIGQSTDIKRRWSYYKAPSFSDNGLLKNSFTKYGVGNHTFEVIEICNKEELDIREIFWIDLLKCNKTIYIDGIGMNLTDGGNKPPIIYGKMSKTVKDKISKKAYDRHRLNKIPNIHQFDKSGNLVKVWDNVDEYGDKTLFFMVKNASILKYKIYQNSFWRFQEDLPYEFIPYPVKRVKKEKPPKKSKEEISEINRKKSLGRKPSKETREKMSKSSKESWTEEKRLYFSKLFKGRKNPWKEGSQSDEYIEKRMSKIRKPVRQWDLMGNLVKEWVSAKEAEKLGNFNSDCISLVCRGLKKSYKNYFWTFKNKTDVEI